MDDREEDNEEKIVATYYRRVSTKDETQVKSFKDQKQFFEDMFEVKDNKESKYILYEKGGYSDYGISGTTLQRENFNKMLVAAGLEIKEVKNEVVIEKTGKHKTHLKYITLPSGRTPLFEEIFVSNTSRFARNIAISEVLNDLRNINVYVTFLDINKTTRKEEDLAILQFFQNFDEMFSRDLSRKVIAGNMRSAEQNVVRTSGNLYGYTYVAKENNDGYNKLIKIDEEALVIQTIFRAYYGCYNREEEYTECNFDCENCKIVPYDDEDYGYGFRVILDILNNKFKYRTRAGKPFAQSTIKNMLDNEKYKGFTNNRKSDHGTVFNKHSYAKTRDHYEVNASKYIDVIVPTLLFDRCTKKRKKRSDIYGQRGVSKGKYSAYKSLIYCANCDSVYTHNISNDKKGFYNCKTKKLHGIDRCANINIFDTDLDAYINTLQKGGLNDLTDSTNIHSIVLIIGVIKAKLKSISDNSNTDKVSTLNRELKKNKKTLSKLYMIKAMNDTDDEVIDGNINTIQKNIKSQTEQLDLFTKKPKIFISECIEMITVCFDIVKIIENKKDTYTEAEVLEIIEKFMIIGTTKKDNTPSIVCILKAAKSATDIIKKYNKDIKRPLFSGVPEFKDIIKDLNDLNITLQTLSTQYS